ncbi:MAG: acyl-CoA dehydrogenase [Gemmatimonadetes bacterium]|nr:MAG: acyl-CoA dehydrogenase [Gemmatimonadota bacterium]
MSLRFTEEQLEIRGLAREFAEGELRPHSAAWDEARALPDEVFASLAELGFLGMRVPEAYGGLDLDPSTYLLVLEELARGDAAVALAVAIHCGPVTDLVLRYGSEAQKQALLPAMASGEALTAFALSEPEAGSDAGALATTAVREGDGWRLDGRKRWVTNGGRADRVLVFARVEGTAGDGLAAFLVDPATEGWQITDRERTMGLRASETAAVKLDGVRVGDDALLGEPGQGFRYAMEALNVGRVGIAAQALGIGQAAYEHATGYAVERRQFGRPIADFGAIQAKLADMEIRLTAARATVHAVGEMLIDADHDARGPASLRARAAAAKVVASEAALWVADEAVQIFGGYGYMRDYPVEKLLRDAKGTEIYEGTNEILRLVVAREVLREVRED